MLKEDFGYHLMRSTLRREHEPGYQVLEVRLSDTPSEHHFDPIRMWLPAAGETGLFELTIEHPWPHRSSARVCGGAVDLIDRKGKQIDAFTFGGQLQIEPRGEITYVRIESPAPILIEEGFSTFEGLLTDEVEIILAERRAAWGNDSEGFETRLAAAEPLGLYFGCLKAVLARLKAISSQDEKILHLKHVLHSEIAALECEVPLTYRLEIESWL